MGTHIYNKIMKSTNEIKVNDPYSYEKAYGESHSFIEYIKSAGETGQYADNFLINIPKAKIIAGFTGWNIPKWARKAEKGDSNFYIASRSAITNPPPYLSTPHIEINDPNSWEPATTAASLIMKYNKNDIDEIKVNDPTPPLPSNISNQIKDEIIKYNPKMKSKIQLIGDSHNEYKSDTDITICVFNSD